VPIRTAGKRGRSTSSSRPSRRTSGSSAAARSWRCLVGRSPTAELAAMRWWRSARVCWERPVPSTPRACGSASSARRSTAMRTSRSSVSSSNLTRTTSAARPRSTRGWSSKCCHRRNRTKTFHQLMSRESFQEHALVSQVEPRVEAMYRHPDGQWRMRFASGSGSDDPPRFARNRLAAGGGLRQRQVPTGRAGRRDRNSPSDFAVTPFTPHKRLCDAARCGLHSTISVPIPASV
jgi:hypothetical protein